MRKHRFYHAGPITFDHDIILSPANSHHINKVLRLTKGDKISLFNNSDQQYLVRIKELHDKQLVVSLVEQQTVNVESPLKLHLGQVISKGQKMELAIQKAVELGVTTISPLVTTRSCSFYKQERWEKIIIAAAAQCGRTSLPPVATATSLLSWCNNITATSKFMLEPTAKQRIGQQPLTNDIALLIGPEGGLATEEIDLATQQGFVPIALGPRILRTETATLAMLAILQNLQGDL